MTEQNEQQCSIAVVCIPHTTYSYLEPNPLCHKIICQECSIMKIFCKSHIARNALIMHYLFCFPSATHPSHIDGRASLIQVYRGLPCQASLSVRGGGGGLLKRGRGLQWHGRVQFDTHTHNFTTVPELAPTGSRNPCPRYLSLPVPQYLWANTSHCTPGRPGMHVYATKQPVCPPRQK